MPYLHPTTYLCIYIIYPAHIYYTYYLYNFMCAILENWHFQMTLKRTMGKKLNWLLFFIDVNWRKWWKYFHTNTNGIDWWNFPTFPQQWFDIHTHKFTHKSKKIYNANDKFNYPVNISNYPPFKQLNSENFHWMDGGCKIVRKCWQLLTLTKKFTDFLSIPRNIIYY